MRKFIINNKGITMIELLAVIVIAGFIGILIWRLFFQSLDYNSREVSKNQLQQEANYIVNTIQKVYTKEKNFKLMKEGEALIITSDVSTARFDNLQIAYDITNTNQLENGDYYLDLILESKKNENINIRVETIFSKIKANSK